MNAINVQDPWAQAIIHGSKRIENRGSRPPEKIIGKRVAVYCTKKWDENEWPARATPGDGPWSEYGPEIPPFRRPTDYIETRALDEFRDGEDTWTVSEVAYQDADKERYDFFVERHAPGHIIGTVKVVGYLDNDKKKKAHIAESPQKTNTMWPTEATDNAWWQGPVGWLLDDPRPFAEPIEVDGSEVMPGVWELSDELAAKAVGRCIVGNKNDLRGLAAREDLREEDITPSRPEPTPKERGEPVAPTLIAYLEDSGHHEVARLVRERDAYGRQKYGQQLHSDDGRDEVEDLRQELGDALQYAFAAKMNGRDLSEIETILEVLMEMVGGAS